VRNHIEKVNAAYKERVNKHKKHMELSLGDPVWLHLRKERFASRTKNKLMRRGDGPFKNIKRVGDDPYKLQGLRDEVCFSQS